MLRVLLTLVALAAGLVAATPRLYLKDGSYHLVREYEVKEDRVRFYSTERSAWEEMPLDLIDLDRTRSEAEEAAEVRQEQKQADRAEAEAERAARREVARVPKEAGVYAIQGGELVTVPMAETKLVSNKKRSILKALSPIPIISGKATLEVDGAHARTSLAGARPEFYIRLSRPERFGIVRTAPAKSEARIIETWNLIPVTKEIVQEQDAVEIFRYQVGEDLYKIWPQKPVEPGEYAIIQYTEGKGNTQVWDFRLAAGSQ